MLRVWGRKTSSNVQAVMWSIAELGLPHERYDFGHRYGGLDTPEFLAMNPNGTIPVVRDNDGEPLWESAAILRYLANRYGRAPYWPDDLAMRTHIDKWAVSTSSLRSDDAAPRRQPDPTLTPAGAARHLERPGFVVTKKPPVGGHPALGRGSRD